MPRIPRRMRQAMDDPGRAWAVVRALLRGQAYRLWFRLTRRRVFVGRNFRVEGRLTIRGPGTVVFGDDVTVAMHVTPWTYSREARITIGDRCILNGTRFACMKEIAIGPDGLIGEAHIMDTSFHSTAKDRRHRSARARVGPVVIGPNVWITFNVGVLPGTKIGANSVVGFGAVCSGDYPVDAIIAGNPAKVLRSVNPVTEPPIQSPS